MQQPTLHELVGRVRAGAETGGAVRRRGGGEVYLEGALERGVAPAQCVWTHGGGAGEDGCLLLLHKMNLELLRRCAAPGRAPPAPLRPSLMCQPAHL